ncbi:type II toxin-antitoxin system ParD family antitoxin [Allopusillimonas ginsengisoli]|uniref:ribbon-helix-helix domain-containing protein n=1 Tax=Allopusillimonas ginsengisoli TaxID=453575 RepID=UPI0039C37987
MKALNISLPDALKAYLKDQADQRSFGTQSEYVQELIRKDQDQSRLRTLLLEGAASASGELVDREYFDALRDRVRLHYASK